MNIDQNGDICKDRILILDFGSQYTQLIARRIRELGVYCEICFFWNVNKKTFIHTFCPSGIILSGSPNSINCHLDRKDFVFRQGIMQYVFQYNIPVLGICYGMHVMVAHFGGKVIEDVSKKEFGRVQLSLVSSSLLMRDIYDYIDEGGHQILDVWMSHSETVITIPQDFVVVGITKDDTIAIVVNEKKKLYGLQFHPEVTHTIQGRRILERFVLEICSCNSLWKTSNVVSHLVTYISNLVKNDTVMLAFSGGIDSFVTALLLQRAVGNRKLMCYCVDTGFLRYDELSYVKKFAYTYSLNVHFLCKSDRFFSALVGIKDPEEKRKIIGRVFIEIFEECRKKLSCEKVWLAQGTIYPDIIESGFCNSFKDSMIKSHHNVGGLPSTGTMKLLEPIKNLFKDEVRNIGRELGISFDILYRHPFPGPGLAIRILGEVKEEYCRVLRQADNIFIEELCKYDLYNKISQAFVVFLPIQSVGVVGDVRKYEWVVALRVVETIDFMTASWVYLPYDFLCKVSNRIIAEVFEISRVVYDISSKPPSTIEWE